MELADRAPKTVDRHGGDENLLRPLQNRRSNEKKDLPKCLQRIPLDVTEDSTPVPDEGKHPKREHLATSDDELLNELIRKAQPPGAAGSGRP